MLKQALCITVTFVIGLGMNHKLMEKSPFSKSFVNKFYLSHGLALSVDFRSKVDFLGNMVVQSFFGK